MGHFGGKEVNSHSLTFSPTRLENLDSRNLHKFRFCGNLDSMCLQNLKARCFACASAW
ncbi:hypothetical protein [Helicobacter jaachi]|uniref:hypothetical protein n=1 Tax=Helicobacter jaachi TaxID=1677920 RepID=UPI001884122F|nr:hypothetical protein [Helicobacter jaachi]